MKTLREVLAIYTKEPPALADKRLNYAKEDGPVTPETRERLRKALEAFRKGKCVRV